MSLIGTLTTGVSALRTFTKGLEVIGNNIANVNTSGYKSASVGFADSFSNTLRAASPAYGTVSSQAALQVGTGVEISSVRSDFSQGALTTTGTPSDMGISGNGFFIVNDSAGNQFATRDGAFRLDNNGYLVTADGYRVQGLTGGTVDSGVSNSSTVGDIQIGANVPDGMTLESYSIGSDGTIVEFYSGNGQSASAQTNRVLLQNFNDASTLTKAGNNRYTSLAAAGPVGGDIFSLASSGGNNPGSAGVGSIQAGTLEQSNVDLTEEFSDMITTQRSFQAGSRLITVSDQVLEEIVNLKH